MSKPYTGTALALAGAVAAGFAAGYVVAKGPQETLAIIRGAWGATDHGRAQEPSQPALQQAGSGRPASLSLRSSDADCLGGGLNGSSSGGANGGGHHGDLSPTASIAGSVATTFSMPPTPIGGQSGSSAFGRSGGGGRGDKLRMVGACGPRCLRPLAGAPSVGRGNWRLSMRPKWAQGGEGEVGQAGRGGRVARLQSDASGHHPTACRAGGKRVWLAVAGGCGV
jgi:hypothetical protein